MKRYKLHVGHCVISILAAAQNQPVWSRRQLKVHKGPTIELTIAFPQRPTYPGQHSVSGYPRYAQEAGRPSQRHTLAQGTPTSPRLN